MVDAALGVLRAGGGESFTMRMVAAELGVSVSSVYWWAGSKELLLAQVVDAVHVRLHLEVAASRPHAR